MTGVGAWSLDAPFEVPVSLNVRRLSLLNSGGKPPGTCRPRCSQYPSEINHAGKRNKSFNDITSSPESFSKLSINTKNFMEKLSVIYQINSSMGIK